MSRIRRFFPHVSLAAATLFAACLPLQGGKPAEMVAGPALHPATSKQVLDEVHRPGASVVLVNIWATWCIPCREEFPDIVRISKEFEARGLRVVLVSADFGEGRETQVSKFLVAQGVTFPSFIKEEKDEIFIDAIDPQWSGALPVSLLYDGSGKQRDMWEGSATYAELKEKVLEVLGPPAQIKQTEEVEQSKEAR